MSSEQGNTRKDEQRLASSGHYLGEKGKRYFEHQDKGGQQRGLINARKFAPYVHPCDTVLDFGCGNGSLLYNLDCERRIGIEINPVARSAAQSLGVEVHPTLDKVEMRSVDVAISNHALEHLPCPLQTCVELQRLVRGGGRLVLCVPIDDWRTQKYYTPNDINHHLYTWTPQLLGNCLAEAGFEVEKIWVYTHAWPPSSWQTLDAYLPVRVFDLVCKWTAWRHKRRQIMALARVR